MHPHLFDSDAFLRDTWQRRPLLIRNPWQQWSNPLTADELAGLACEEEVEARLIRQSRKTWLAEHGPFRESRFGQFGRQPWTLLVQAVDQHVPAVADLLAHFRFLPNWRIDDVMVSYATDRGGVGPHFDQYDVFLIQGAGKRRWQVGGLCDAATPLLPHDDLRLLAHFEPEAEWVLEAGDILYIPPRVAHNGIAVGDDCMTYSIGFRAPSRSELIAHWCDRVLDEVGNDANDDDRYADPGIAPQANPGEITAPALARLQAMVLERLADPEHFARWFGSYTTARKYPEIDWTPESPVSAADVRTRFAAGATLLRNPAFRFAYADQSGGGALLFIDGECTPCSGASANFARTLCADERPVPAGDVTDAVAELIATLINQGSVGFDEG